MPSLILQRQHTGAALAAVVPISTSTGSPLSVSQSRRAHASSSAAASFNRARTLAAASATTSRHVARRRFSSSSSSSGSGGDGKPEEQQQKQQERDIKQPSMDVEKDVATALRGVQELHRAGKYTEVSQGDDWSV